MSKKEYTKIRTPEFRVSFPSVFEAKSFDGGAAKFSVVMIFPKGTDLKPLKDLAQKAVLEMWPDATKRPKNLKNPLRDGDTDRSDRPEFAGSMFATASTKMRPGVVGLNKGADGKLVQLTAEQFYAGCYAHATITAYAYSNKGNSGVAFGLQNVQKLRDGEKLSGSAKPDDDFDAVEGTMSEEEQTESLFN